MAAANLINLNVDTLFEQHSVPEIVIVHKKIQTVVEERRENLRTMVGERYRDLLKAADTIGAMQTSAGTLTEQVHAVRTNCRKLNEQQLIGFKTNSDSNETNIATATESLHMRRIADKQLSNYYSTMVQIKLLTSLPELIWTHIDQEQFYAATELFIFSRHISTGLQLDAKNALMQQLPVARKQWEILRTFHLTLKQCILKVLEREVLSTETTVDCLLSLLLLDKCSLSQLLQTFLQLRCAAFSKCLSDDSDMEQHDRRRVKERILASLRVLNGSIELLDKCFLENGQLFQRIAEYTQDSTPPSIARMESSERQLAHLLPDIIANFRPKFETLTLEESDIRDALGKWLSDTSRIETSQLKQLFILVTNMQTIQEIKNEANAYKRQHNFASLAERYGQAHCLDFYDLRYVPLINERIRDIISDSWTLAITQTYESLMAALKQAAANDLPNIWLDEKSDLPLSLAEALSEELKGKKLLNKTKGYDARIIKICEQFDAQLASIIAELNVLLQEQTTRVDDKLALVVFLRETAQTKLTHFISQIKSLELSKRTELLLVVRCCVALVELCPNLKICFCQQSSWRQWIGSNITTASNLEHWQRMCGLLEDETLQFWLLLLDGLLAEQQTLKVTETVAAHDIMLEDFVNWQTITLEQNDEQDNAVQSSIRIPIQPRISLQTQLFALIRALNDNVPETLPTKVLQLFNHKLLAQLLEQYEKLANGDETKASQNVSLQLYFDLKFLQGLFGISREERKLHERFNRLQKSLRDCIDPFDFELFAEHIIEHVKRAVQRLSGEFGTLTANTSTTSTTAAAAGAGAMAQLPLSIAASALDAEPNVLCLSSSGSTSLWFPLLPIVATATHHERKMTATVDLDKKQQQQQQQQQQQHLSTSTTTTPTRKSTTTTATTTTTRKSDTNKSKSGAASFFGMSQEWFR